LGVDAKRRKIYSNDLEQPDFDVVITMAKAVPEAAYALPRLAGLNCSA
jgi:hypothetical protein